MPTFMLDSGRLAPVAHPGIVPDGFTEDWCALVRRDALDLADCDAFPVVWDCGSPALLSAMRADGGGLGVAVVPRLDLVTLAELLARAGQVAAKSWADLAGRYPRGEAAFRRDWNAFREARVLPTQPLPALVVIAGSISVQVGQTLPLLGRVQLLLAQVRRSETGAQLLDIGPLGAGAASTPVRPSATACPDLTSVAAMVRAPVPIEYHHGRAKQSATLALDGTVVLPDGSEYTDLGLASTGIASGEPPDPWQAWRFTDGHFPLAEARAEARRLRARSNGSRPPGRPEQGRRVRV